MPDKTKIVDAYLFRRVKRGQDQATLSIEPSESNSCLFDVLIETNQGTQQAEASFESIKDAIAFFNHATRKLLNSKQAMDAFDVAAEKDIFFQVQ